MLALLGSKNTHTHIHHSDTANSSPKNYQSMAYEHNDHQQPAAVVTALPPGTVSTEGVNHVHGSNHAIRCSGHYRYLIVKMFGWGVMMLIFSIVVAALYVEFRETYSIIIGCCLLVVGVIMMIIGGTACWKEKEERKKIVMPFQQIGMVTTMYGNQGQGSPPQLPGPYGKPWKPPIVQPIPIGPLVGHTPPRDVTNYPPESLPRTSSKYQATGPTQNFDAVTPIPYGRPAMRTTLSMIPTISGQRLMPSSAGGKQKPLGRDQSRKQPTPQGPWVVYKPSQEVSNYRPDFHAKPLPLRESQWLEMDPKQTSVIMQSTTHGDHANQTSLSAVPPIPRQRPLPSPPSTPPNLFTHSQPGKPPVVRPSIRPSEEVSNSPPESEAEEQSKSRLSLELQQSHKDPSQNHEAVASTPFSRQRKRSSLSVVPPRSGQKPMLSPTDISANHCRFGEPEQLSVIIPRPSIVNRQSGEVNNSEAPPRPPRKYQQTELDPTQDYENVEPISHSRQAERASLSVVPTRSLPICTPPKPFSYIQPNKPPLVKPTLPSPSIGPSGDVSHYQRDSRSKSSRKYTEQLFYEIS
ncbi:leucine-rich repeat extensin-like protein 5 isoform X1 [Acanthaster planci]|uniref:Leucine-rich repeat extensin-like protein 5 isoform X1 n=2 Tax=Acanthaster planci TaxID=133434 RepID=A0A8B7ZF00_ACAPL|nr:leucine-rich repeat extensin-like protein 5 isoform X1 [Acanthaster planci]